MEETSRLATFADRTFTDVNDHRPFSSRNYFPYTTTLADEDAAFGALLTCTKDLRHLVTVAVETDTAFRAKYSKNLGPSLISAAQDAAKAIALHILDPEDHPDTDMIATDTASHEHIVPANTSQREADTYRGIKRQCYTPYIRSLLDESKEEKRLTQDGAKLLPNLLRTVAYTFGNTHGQVVPGILHESLETNKELQEATIALHRLLMLISVYIRTKEIEDIVPQILHVPHKRRKVGDAEVWDSNSDRHALVADAGPATDRQKHGKHTAGTDLWLAGVCICWRRDTL